MKKLMVTGAGGLLAEELIAQLINKNIEHIIAVSTQSQTLEKKYSVYPQVSCLSWDALSGFDFSGVDAVVHCAFARKEECADISDSLCRTAELLTFVGKSGKKIPFVQISSRSVYGQQEPLWTEDTHCEPASPYALGKVMQELLLRQAAQFYGFPFTILRLSALICPRMNQRIVYKMVQQAVVNGRIKVIGGTQQFSLLDCRDAASGIIALLRRDAGQWKDIYNLGTMECLRLEQIAELIRTVGKEAYQICVTIEKESREVHMVDGMVCTRFYEDTRWQPQYHMHDIIAHLFDHCIHENQR